MGGAGKPKGILTQQSSIDTDDMSQDSTSTTSSFIPIGGTTDNKTESRNANNSSVTLETGK